MKKEFACNKNKNLPNDIDKRYSPVEATRFHCKHNCKRNTNQTVTVALSWISLHPLPLPYSWNREIRGQGFVLPAPSALHLKKYLPGAAVWGEWLKAVLGVIPLSSATLTESWVYSHKPHHLVFMPLCDLPLSVGWADESLLTKRI